MIFNNNVKRGNIYYVEKYQTNGSEQQSGRPALVVSNDKNNENSDVVEIVYLTTAPKKDLPTHVTIRGTGRDSIALCEQVTSVSKNRFTEFICTASDKEMIQIEMALSISLDLKLLAQEPHKLENQGLKETTTISLDHHHDTQHLDRIAELEKELLVQKTEKETYKSIYFKLLDIVKGGA